MAVGLVAACSGNSDAVPERGPVVLAASSLQEAMEDIADDWQAQGNPAVQLSFASSAALARQIESGAPADVFISADEEWMGYLRDRDALSSAKVEVIATNSLVLIGPREGHSEPSGTQALSPDNAKRAMSKILGSLGTERLAIGDPVSVPAGRYGKAALTDLGMWGAVARNIVPAENVRAALAFVARGEAALGIVYATDAKASEAVRVVGAFPASSHPAIVYPAAVLKTARSKDAEPFLTFLTSAEAQAVLARYGFGPKGP